MASRRRHPWRKMSNCCLDSCFAAATKPSCHSSGSVLVVDVSWTRQFSSNQLYLFGLSDSQSCLQVLHGSPEPDPQLATPAKKNSLWTGRNLEWDQASGPEGTCRNAGYSILDLLHPRYQWMTVQPGRDQRWTSFLGPIFSWSLQSFANGKGHSQRVFWHGTSRIDLAGQSDGIHV